MTNTPDIEEIERRAREAQENRVQAVKTLAEARQTVEDNKELLAAAEDEHLAAWKEAVSIGWPEPELKKLGFKEPEKKRRSKRNTGPRQRSSDSSNQQNERTSENTDNRPTSLPDLND